MDFKDLYRLVFGHFGLRATGPPGHRATGQTADSATGVLSCVLYETFEWQCRIDPQYNIFGAVILVGSNQATSEFFGRGVSMSLDATSVAASLDTIDRWCRLHLPQAFLEE